jgi:hypothetical protein
MDRTERHHLRYGSKGAFLGNKQKQKEESVKPKETITPKKSKKED